MTYILLHMHTWQTNYIINRCLQICVQVLWCESTLVWDIGWNNNGHACCHYAQAINVVWTCASVLLNKIVRCFLCINTNYSSLFPNIVNWLPTTNSSHAHEVDVRPPSLYMSTFQHIINLLYHCYIIYPFYLPTYVFNYFFTSINLCVCLYIIQSLCLLISSNLNIYYINFIIINFF